MYGSQEPTRSNVPACEGNHADKAAAMMERAGRNPMEWQRAVLRAWLGRVTYEDEDTGLQRESWAAHTCGLSVPRQNGKTECVAYAIVWCMVAYNAWVVYTSHLQRTSTETFETVRSILESEALKPMVSVIKTALGREEIRMRGGGRVQFVARTRNSGRGLHADMLVMDEAQSMDESAMSALMPTLAASANPMSVYVGTPPDPNDYGEVFKRVRAEALSGGSSTAWLEWSVQCIGDVSDESRWLATNPSMGYLIRRDTVSEELKAMAPDIFARERLGWWPETTRTVKGVISEHEWDACEVPAVDSSGVRCMAVKFSPDGASVAVAAAARHADGTTAVELVRFEGTANGTGFLVDFLQPRFGQLSQIVVDGASGAQAFAERLVTAGCPRKALIRPKTYEAVSAYSGLLNAIRERTVSHSPQETLRESATLTERRPIGTGGGWGFKTTSFADAAPIEAAALAHWAAIRTKRDPSRKMRVN